MAEDVDTIRRIILDALHEVMGLGLIGWLHAFLFTTKRFNRICIANIPADIKGVRVRRWGTNTQHSNQWNKQV